ncbi:MAG: hypothetical protein ACE14S_01670 [Candidatus Bathyarchaeia archaeon]
MIELTRSTKAWIAATLVLLFLYNAYWTEKSYTNLVGFLLQWPTEYGYVSRLGGIFWMGHAGLTARFIAIALGLAAVFLLWVKKKPFGEVKRLVSVALVLEAVNFVGLLPSAWRMVSAGGGIFAPFLGMAYFLQCLFTAPFMLVLAAKVWNYGKAPSASSLWSWAAVAFAGYVTALAVNAVFRWFDMVSIGGLTFLLTGIISIGFVSAVTLTPLAVASAVIGAHVFREFKTVSALSWAGLALAAIGLYYVVYWVYSYFANSLNFALLVDTWTVPLLGLGIALILQSRRTLQQCTPTKRIQTIPEIGQNHSFR